MISYASSNVLWRGVSVTGEFLFAPESLNDTAWAFNRFLFLQNPEVLPKNWNVVPEKDLLPQPDSGLGGTGVGGHAGRGLEAALAPLLLSGEGRLLQKQGPGQTRLRGLEGRGVDGGLDELRGRGGQGLRPVDIQG